MAKPTRGIGDKWIQVCRLLNSRNVEYIVVGGVAVGLHGAVRATKDLDILVPRSVENTRRLLDALSELPMRLARELDAETETRKHLTIIGDDPRGDVLKGAGGLNYDRARRSTAEATVDGVRVPYASLDDLIASKQNDREEDKLDIRNLTRLKKAAKQTADPTPNRNGAPNRNGTNGSRDGGVDP